ncbi:MAG: SoxR reducing system RseC family protein [Nitrospiraceae bacterium]|nr:SoxR reducing system RseC family protein [Nitrospiraceae bacterium]
MEEIGIVKSIDGVLAKVSVPKKSICEGCTAGTCKPDAQTMEIDAVNKVNASIGQKVRVVINSYTYLGGSIIVYGLPAIALIAGAIIGKDVVSPKMSDMNSDLVSAIFGFGAFLLSFIVIKLWSMKAEKKTESRPVIEEILND